MAVNGFCCVKNCCWCVWSTWMVIEWINYCMYWSFRRQHIGRRCWKVSWRHFSDSFKAHRKPQSATGRFVTGPQVGISSICSYIELLKEISLVQFFCMTVILTVTVTVVFVLHPMLEDWWHITKQLSVCILLSIGRLCFNGQVGTLCKSS